jgi:hypothetical protein
LGPGSFSINPKKVELYCSTIIPYIFWRVRVWRAE